MILAPISVLEIIF